MRCILVLAVLAFVPGTISAQQSETDVCSGLTLSSPTAEQIRCLQFQRQQLKDMEERDKATQAKLAEANKAAEEAERALDDLKKIRSRNTATKIDGMTDAGKDANSHANNNPASKKVTDQSIDVIGHVAQSANKSLDNTQNASNPVCRYTLTRQARTALEGHTDYVKSTKAKVESGTRSVDERYQEQQEQEIQISPSVTPTRSVVTAVEPASKSAGSRSIAQRYNDQENAILLSPSNVNVVANADHAGEKLNKNVSLLKPSKQRQIVQNAPRTNVFIKSQRQKLGPRRPEQMPEKPE